MLSEDEMMSGRIKEKKMRDSDYDNMFSDRTKVE